MSLPSAHDRIVGGILGTLVGDALGVPVEFQERATLDRDPVVGMRSGGTWNQPAGTWSDDGAMCLVTADVLCHLGWDLENLMIGFDRWLYSALWTARGGVFDIGHRTRSSIERFRAGEPAGRCGGDQESDNGNGSLMRALPVSCWLHRSPSARRIRLAGDASALTHAHPRSRWCCAWHAAWCDAVLAGGETSAAAAAANAQIAPLLPPAERAALARILDGRLLGAPRQAIASGGYVVHTLEAAVWCLLRYVGFAETVLAAVNLGGDTDTTAAVAGGMAGLRGGAAAIPAGWLAALPRHEEVTALAHHFADACLATREDADR